MHINIERLSYYSHYKLRDFDLSCGENFEKLDSCPICNGDQLELLYKTLKGPNEEDCVGKVLCLECGHAFYNQFPTIKWLEKFYKDIWNSETATHDRPYYKVKPNYTTWAPIHYLRDLNIAKDSKVLDFGCGYGDTLKSLEVDGFTHCFGLEVGKHRFEVASQTFPGRVLLGSVEALPKFESIAGKFNLIFSNHVFEHLADPLSVVVELKKALDPSGVIAISVPAPGSESAVHAALYYPHLHAYSGYSLAMVLEKAGFTTRIWHGSDLQLCVLGFNDSHSVDIERFGIIRQDSNEVVLNHRSIRDEFESQLAASSSEKHQQTMFGISFSHPWQAKKKFGKSGTLIHGGLFTKVIGLSEKVAPIIERILPKTKKNLVKTYIRYIFYKTLVKLGLGQTVDNLLCRIHHNDSEGITFSFNGRPKIMDK